MSTKQVDDNLPDSGDPQLSDLYRVAADENPPERLDAAIQAAARRAAGARPRAAGPSWLRAWRVPLSIAAVLVMSVSMVTLTVRQKGGQLMEPPPTASVPGPATAPAVADNNAAAPQAAPSAPKSVAAVAGHKSAATDRTETARSSAPAMPEAETAAATASASASQPQAYTPPAESRVAAAQEERAGAPARSLAKMSPAAAPEAAGVEARAMRRERAAGATTDAAPPASALVRELDTQPPEKWLEKILGLRQQGKTQEADELLAEFRKRHPNHPVPPSLH